MRPDNISKSYGDVKVFDNFSAELENGKVTWIMGESGSGKTTLLRIIAGLEEYEGTISDMPSGNISMVFQEDRLFEELSAAENCLLASKASRSDISAYLAEAGLSSEEIDRPAKLLSGGQKRRTAIIRALVTNADIILMDEPFKGIDEKNKAGTAKLVSRLTEGKTVVAVTHDIGDTELIKGNILDLRK